MLHLKSNGNKQCDSNGEAKSFGQNEAQCKNCGCENREPCENRRSPIKGHIFPSSDRAMHASGPTLLLPLKYLHCELDWLWSLLIFQLRPGSMNRSPRHFSSASLKNQY